MIANSITVLLCLLNLNQCYCSEVVKDVVFEAEDATATNGPVGSQMHRSAASDRMTFLLFEGSFIQHDFSIQAKCIANVKDVAYSNDGPSDQINITLASTEIGSFTTIAERGNGHLWNEIRNTGPIGEAVSLLPGSYKLRLKVVHADANGVEIDKSTVRFACDGDPGIQSAGDGPTGNLPHALTAGEIVGIAIGAVGVVAGVCIGIPGCIVAALKFKRCAEQ